jgi:hypothetical protein
MNDYVSRDIRVESDSYEGNPESVTREALKYVRILAPNDQDAQKAILVTVQALYWATDIPVSEIGKHTHRACRSAQS